MDWKGREQSQNVEDRRGSRGGGGGKTPGILGIIVVFGRRILRRGFEQFGWRLIFDGHSYPASYPTRQPTRSRVERTVPRRPCRYGKSMGQILSTTRSKL